MGIPRVVSSFLCVVLVSQVAWTQGQNVPADMDNFLSWTNYAQTEESVCAQDSSQVAFDAAVLKKNYLVGTLGMVASNLLIMGWNRFVIGAGWTKVTWDKVWPPWEREVEFDTDWYWTNFVLHPYQGGLYYMSARNANLNVAESLAMSLVGSAMWEYFCETNDPSINDLVYTTLGGFVVGEMLYRLGLEAQTKSTILGFLFNPVRLVTDPLTGHKPNGPTGNIHALSFKGGFSTAIAGTWFQRDYDFSREVFPASAMIEASVVYGDPYGHESHVPYSQFELSIGGGLGIGSGFGADSLEKKLMYDIHIFSNGMIYSRSVDWGDGCDTTLGLVCDYDFMWHSFMEFSSIAPGFAIKQRRNGKDGMFEWQAHIGAVLLGTSDFYYFRRDVIPVDYGGTVRDYGYSFGGETVGKVRWTSGKHLLDADLHGYAMYKFPFQRQANDDTGWELFGLLDLSYEYAVSDSISLGISNECYMKKAFYDEKPNLFSVLNTPSVYVRYRQI